MEIHDKKQLAAICIERLKKNTRFRTVRWITSTPGSCWWKCALLHSAPMPA